MEKGRVLLVDDEEIFLVVLQKELKEAGHYVRTALGGQEAVKIVKEEKPAFDVIYTDLVMPGMNGVEVCREIKKLSPNSEIVLISGYPSEIQQYQIAFWNAGGRDEVLRRPLAEGELSEVTERILKEIRRK